MKKQYKKNVEVISLKTKLNLNNTRLGLNQRYMYTMAVSISGIRMNLSHQLINACWPYQVLRSIGVRRADEMVKWYKYCGLQHMRYSTTAFTSQLSSNCLCFHKSSYKNSHRNSQFWCHANISFIPEVLSVSLVRYSTQTRPDRSPPKVSLDTSESKISPDTRQPKTFSTNNQAKDQEPNVTDKTDTPPALNSEQTLSIFQRFKKAYKEHGKILVAVHVATSIVWFGSFYFAVRSGLNIVPLLENWGFSEKVICPFRAGGLGDLAMAYLMYKLATPARYTVTLGGTNLVIRYLRNIGRMPPRSKEDSLREFYKEGKRTLKKTSLRSERLRKLQAAQEKRRQEKQERSKINK